MEVIYYHSSNKTNKVYESYHKQGSTQLNLPSMQETPSASNLNPDLHEQMTSSPFVVHSCEQPPLDGLSHGWTGNKKKSFSIWGCQQGFPKQKNNRI